MVHSVVVSENFTFIVTDHHRDDTVTRVVWEMVTWRKKARVRRRQNIPAASPAGVVDGSSAQPEAAIIRRRTVVRRENGHRTTTGTTRVPGVQKARLRRNFTGAHPASSRQTD